MRPESVMHLFTGSLTGKTASQRPGTLVLTNKLFQPMYTTAVLHLMKLFRRSPPISFCRSSRPETLGCFGSTQHGKKRGSFHIVSPHLCFTGLGCATSVGSALCMLGSTDCPALCYTYGQSANPPTSNLGFPISNL